MDFIVGLSAVYLNPFLAIWLLVTLTRIVRKIVKDEDYRSQLWLASILLAWLVFTFTYFSIMI
ncbi:hypothetical protein [Brevibacillus brevis]|uniref:DUF1656 domain-containing protein n=1 Tax=Brevibacillus brevis TaxID=1393 RepID=A0ABY9SYY7_BREBE|nr:hypothetical protein [Brevibacillus brevis]WNC12933.1 hypothetical protein RGB73_19685 [Brevibacillus brevis]